MKPEIEEEALVQLLLGISARNRTWEWPVLYLGLFVSVFFSAHRIAVAMLVAGMIGFISALLLSFIPLLVQPSINNPTAYLVLYVCEILLFYIIGAFANGIIPATRPRIKLILMSVLGGSLGTLLYMLLHTGITVLLDAIREWIQKI